MVAEISSRPSKMFRPRELKPQTHKKDKSSFSYLTREKETHPRVPQHRDLSPMCSVNRSRKSIALCQFGRKKKHYWPPLKIFPDNIIVASASPPMKSYYIETIFSIIPFKTPSHYCMRLRFYALSPFNKQEYLRSREIK